MVTVKINAKRTAARIGNSRIPQKENDFMGLLIYQVDSFSRQKSTKQIDTPQNRHLSSLMPTHYWIHVDTPFQHNSMIP